jgi:hypothetical protein
MTSHVHSEPTRSTSPPRPPSSSKTPKLDRRHPIHKPSYPPVTKPSSYHDPYKGSPAIVYGGTGAPPLVAQAGFSTPQFYTTSATRPPVMTPVWGPPVYIDGQGPYFAPAAPPAPPTWYQPSHHRRSPSPPVQAIPSWAVPLPASHMYAHSEPARPWPPPTHQPPIQGHPPPQRPPSAPRRPSSTKPLSRPKTMSSNPQGLDDFISKWAVGAHCM